MNILFLTLHDFSSLDTPGIYTDLMREFIINGHQVDIVSPSERRMKKGSQLILEQNYRILKPQIGNIQKTNIFEKGLSTITLEFIIKNQINRFFFDRKYDLLLYSTPPITFLKVVRYIKNRDSAFCYLLLKDIFPQNAIDLSMILKSGLLHKYFRKKEKKLYSISDCIGCMSKANVDYIIKHNPEVDYKKVHECPNSISPKALSSLNLKNVRQKYNISSEAIILIYGGNLGEPQGIPFMIECLRAYENRKDCFFIICGTGRKYNLIQKYIDSNKPTNTLLINGLPAIEYTELVAACNVGLIFLDHRFTVPNFPSRLLSYMEAALPVIACTDGCTDVGKIIIRAKFGWCCESANVDDFSQIMEVVLQSKDLKKYGLTGREYLEKYYTSSVSYDIIIKKMDAYMG